jgi:hypothetical protein
MKWAEDRLHDCKDWDGAAPEMQIHYEIRYYEAQECYTFTVPSSRFTLSPLNGLVI